LFAECQYERDGFPCARFSGSTRVAWIDARRVSDGAAAWVPAQLVLLGETLVDGCTRIGYATSNGTACGASHAEAVERGLYELLERDAFMIVWANRLSLPLLDWSGDERLAAVDRRVFATTGLRYGVIDLSVVHELPSFLGVVRARAGVSGALGVGAGTAANVERAWWKALSEAFASRAASVKLALLDGDTVYGACGEGVVDFEDHIRYYEDHGRAAGAAFLDSSDARSPVERVPKLEGTTAEERVSALSDRVARAGSEAYAVDVTSPDVQELGLVVAKVLAPELCALDVPHAARFLGGHRLYAAAAELGLRARPLLPDEINPEPHPFP
jgi:ribosomal protein S12 methylthiotransferase accessory factor